MSTFFTSDSHFFHRNIIKFCDRPYKDLDEMHIGMINEWNSVVTPADVVYHLGDFAFSDSVYKIENILVRLNGIKHLVPGNHDTERNRSQIWAELAWRGHLEIMPLLVEKKIEDQQVTLCHYPIESWNRHSLHIHGHTHGTSRLVHNRLDVGVDNVGFKPLTLQQVQSRISKQNNDLSRIR